MDINEIIAGLRKRADHQSNRCNFGEADFLRAAAAELEMLSGIVARLPRTADGVPVVPGMRVWYAYSDDGFAGPHMAEVLGLDSDQVKIRLSDDCWVGTEDVYSTRAAADAAKGR